jgi:hypothetical protein
LFTSFKKIVLGNFVEEFQNMFTFPIFVLKFVKIFWFQKNCSRFSKNVRAAKTAQTATVASQVAAAMPRG